MMPEDPRTRTIVVTGAGSGIGRACALRLAGAAAQIVALDRDEESARRTADDVRAAGGLGTAVTCDITDDAAVRAALADIAAVNVLVNSAGVDDQIPLADITAADMLRVWQVNVMGLLAVTQAALTKMPDGGQDHQRRVAGLPGLARPRALRRVQGGRRRADTHPGPRARRPPDHGQRRRFRTGPAPPCWTSFPQSGSGRQPPATPAGAFPNPGTWLTPSPSSPTRPPASSTARS